MWVLVIQIALTSKENKRRSMNIKRDMDWMYCHPEADIFLHACG